MVGKLAVIVPFVALMAGACAAPQNTAAPQQEGEANVKQLLLLMDRDQNGKVSRAEFMSFMNAEFDRLDVNKDGELDVNELTGLRVAPGHPGGAGSK
jgi:Ca2+-binding EF-hand superfamily protein